MSCLCFPLRRRRVTRNSTVPCKADHRHSVFGSGIGTLCRIGRWINAYLGNPVIREEIMTEEKKEKFVSISLPSNLLPWLIAWTVLVFVAGVGLGVILDNLVWGTPPLGQAQLASSADELVDEYPPVEDDSFLDQLAELLDTANRADFPIDESAPSRGDENAPITMVLFEDYECPYCSEFHSENFPKIMENYGDQMRVVYYDFPLTAIHPQAMNASNAARCANEQGKFSEFSDALFALNTKLSEAQNRNIAESLGLSLDQFDTCVSETRYQDEIQGNFFTAAQFGISSTPTMIINGFFVYGNQPYEVFELIMDYELVAHD